MPTLYRSDADIVRLFVIAFLGVLVSHVHAADGPPSFFERLGNLLSGKEEAVRQPQTQTVTAATGMSTTQQAPAADHQRRVALVIGNNAYRHVGPLDNAVGDARAVAKELDALGFEVILRTDADLLGMRAAVGEFTQKVADGGFGAFFYAGHGVQDGGNNYLLPVDIGILTGSAALPAQAMEFNGDVMARLEEVGADFSLLVVDACRNNPFPRQGGYTVGGARGLILPNAPDPGFRTPRSAASQVRGGGSISMTAPSRGMVVIYSAGIGQQALDRLDAGDRDPNGLFTREFIREMRKPGLEIAQIVRNVHKRVKAQAASVQHTQAPAIYIQTADRVYLFPNAEKIVFNGPAFEQDPEQARRVRALLLEATSHARMGDVDSVRSYRSRLNDIAGADAPQVLDEYNIIIEMAQAVHTSKDEEMRRVAAERQRDASPTRRIIGNF